jgi:cytochrome c oxidase assembly protein subunit 15
VFLANIVAQAGIVVTGGVVRLTGSGLGCPTWPQCAPGSYVPTAHQAQGYHKYIEFSNRTLTFVVLLTVAAAMIMAWRQVPRRRPLVLLAAAGVLGVVAQAVLGGITVLTGLNPYTVSAHFLLSMALIAAAVALYERGNEPGDGPATSLVRSEVVWLSRGVLVLAGLVLVLGTVVTGSGPHSGDAVTPARFGLDPRTMSWLHADVVLLFIGTTLTLLVALRLTDGPLAARRRVLVLIAVSLGQGFIGYLQYFTGLPEAIVAVHLLGATLVWISTLRIPFALRQRAVEPTGTPTPDADPRAVPTA